MHSFPSSAEIDCGDPGDLVDGSNDLTDGTIYQSVVTYQCDTGYTLVGIDTRVCQETGLWSGDAPTCSGINSINENQQHVPLLSLIN